MDLTDIQELFRYNQWANDRAFDCVCRLTVNEFTKDLSNSFPSVRDTLTHIVWAEWIWLQRWKGTSPQQVFDATEFPHANALNRHAHGGRRADDDTSGHELFHISRRTMLCSTNYLLTCLAPAMHTWRWSSPTADQPDAGWRRRADTAVQAKATCGANGAACKGG